jgi:putative effector of murein hydrolase LrgA (UPF0299 family)
MYSTLSGEVLNRFPHLPVGKPLDGLFQCRVLLADDLVKMRWVRNGFPPSRE